MVHPACNVSTSGESNRGPTGEATSGRSWARVTARTLGTGPWCGVDGKLWCPKDVLVILWFEIYYGTNPPLVTLMI
jgi:hypothetical protein